VCDPGKVFDCTLVAILTCDNKIGIVKGEKCSHLGICKTMEPPNAVESFNPNSVLKICE